MAAYQDELARIGRQVSAPQPASAAWTPPAIGELAKRVEDALRGRWAA